MARIETSAFLHKCIYTLETYSWEKVEEKKMCGQSHGWNREEIMGRETLSDKRKSCSLWEVRIINLLKERIVEEKREE